MAAGCRLQMDLLMLGVALGVWMDGRRSIRAVVGGSREFWFGRSIGTDIGRCRARSERVMMGRGPDR